MKKCTLILMAVLTIAACKKEKEDSQEANSSVEQKTTLNPECITLADYYAKTTLDEKIAWLKEKGDSVCKDTLEKAVLKIHQVKGKVTNQKGKYSISWRHLKDTIKDYGYNKYLRLIVDTTKQQVLGLSMVPDYKKGTYCFSTALIRSLAKNYAKDDNNVEFHFSFAIIDKSEDPVIVIQVIDPNNIQSVNESYFDYSTDPSKKDLLNSINIPL
ncbi:hypothetical protein [Flavobacterium fluviatile]|uniref:hypothetical protein n=1 Tax=Flavobacterium fluviatile TaxID=1862387 RepID=UPI0013D244F8|nr:hypothetical protein [Flavobacterium fluviatile]